ncbi:alpha/beta hydrolase [Tessaracoccus terricola]
MTARRRAGRILTGVLGSLGALLALLVIGMLVWSQVGVLAAEPEPLAAVQGDPAVEVSDVGGALVLALAGETAGAGLVFIPGGKVEAEAYVARLAGVVAEEGVTVVITRPWLNLAFFDLRGLDSFTRLAPDVDTWLVGGHSLGGVRACSLAEDAEALVLFASYCATDLSASGIPVLSISGSEDGLSTPAKISDAAHLLPEDAEFVEIAGASHASFGDYGPQSGDGTPTIGDDEMSAEVTRLLAELVASLR